MIQVSRIDWLSVTISIVLVVFITFVLAFPFIAPEAQGQQQARPARPDPQVRVLDNGWVWGDLNGNENWFNPSAILHLQIDERTVENNNTWPVLFIDHTGGKRFRLDCPTVERAHEIADILLAATRATKEK